MRLKTFFGGVHPKDWKYLAKDSATKVMPLPKVVLIDLAQHIGAPSKPIVKVGQTVLSGELIAQKQGAVSCNIHSSISGTVKKIGTSINTSGKISPSITIESDGLDKWVDLTDDKKYLSLSNQEIMNRIVETGLCGMGGAGFPTHIKLTAKGVDTLILNGVECEPFITSDYRLMIENSCEIVFGMEILMKILNVKRGFIGIEQNKPKAIKIMKKATKDYKNIKVVPLKLKYPQGAEKPLIKACTKREVPIKGGLPADVNVVVQNVATAFSVYQGVRYKKPLIERIVTISGTPVRRPRNIWVRVGTQISELLEYCGGTIDSVDKIISGGPMMGVSIPSNEGSISKTTSSILYLTKDQNNQKPEHTCIRCGRCIDVCPLFLLPSRMANASKHEKWAEALDCGAKECMLCGCCSYVCPSNIKIVQWISVARDALSK